MPCHPWNTTKQSDYSAHMLPEKCRRRLIKSKVKNCCNSIKNCKNRIEFFCQINQLMLEGQNQGKIFQTRCQQVLNCSGGLFGATLSSVSRKTTALGKSAGWDNLAALSCRLTPLPPDRFSAGLLRTKVGT